MRVLLDTNVISEWVKPQPSPHVIEWLTVLDDEEAFLSVMTLGELRAGIEQLDRGRRRAHLEMWLGRDLPHRFDGRIISVDHNVAAEWGKMIGHARRSGTPLGAVDALLAATASVHRLALATRNVRHFAATSLHLVDPWQPSG